MNRLIDWFLDNRIAANLLMAVLVVAGLLALPTIHQEEFPSIEVDAVSVRVPYLGAAPEEVENAVCIRIEEAVEGTEGIDKIRSTAAEGYCSVIIELVEGVDRTKVSNDIKSKVDAVDSFPVETEQPVTAEISISRRVLQLAIHGDTDERSLKILGQQMRDEIAALPGVSQVDLLYTRPYEIAIEVAEHTLRRHGLTLEEVGQAIQGASLDVPGGHIKTQGGEILLRTVGQSYRGDEFREIVVLTRTDGTNVTLGDIATVVDGFEDSGLQARLDGQRSVGIEVRSVGKEDTLDIAAAVKTYVEEARHRVPAGIELTIWDDESRDLVDRLNALGKNARSGLILVLLVLTLFLRFRLAIWVAAGIPVAMLGTIAMFPALNLSISSISIMAFILVLGILVDDAIVVGERIYTYEQQGMSRMEAASRGTRDVSVPVIFGVLTTMATFLPLVAISSGMGAFFQPLGVVVIVALFFSIVESQLVLPSHLAHRKAERGQARNIVLKRWLAFQERLSGGLQRIADDVYLPAVTRVTEWRYLAVAVALGLLLIMGSLFVSGRLVFQFFPAVEGKRIFAVLHMPEGTPIEYTAAAAAQIEDGIERLRQELDADRDSQQGSVVKHVFTSVGTLLPKNGSGMATESGNHLAEVGVELDIPSHYTGLSTGQWANRLRELTGSIPDAVELTFHAQSMSMGKPVDIELAGSNFDELSSAAAELRAVLPSYPGIMDITDTYRAGKQEVRLELLPEARALGLTTRDLGQQVRQAFYGYEAQRVQRGHEDIRVMVRYPENERLSLGNLEQMRIRTADGNEVPFSSVARVELSRGFTSINRKDGQRVVSVSADVNRNVVAPEVVLADLEERVLPQILASHPGVVYQLAGESEESAESLASLGSLALLALLIIFALLAIPLKSYLQPLVIMSVIPFGAMGAIVGHLIMGMDLVFFSILGIVALSGVVVNSSLVLVDFINRTRLEGQELARAVSHAGAARFRPIVLTSMTTFLGLSPMMLDKNLATIILVPMSISLAFGVVFGTVITLFLVPCLYMVLEDFKNWQARRGAPSAIAAQE
ncbi:MAG: efflux RND transporter permease subunit [Pseudomonadota bacterium]